MYTMINRLKIFLITLLIGGAVGSFSEELLAQNNSTISPYSRYGIGDLSSGTTGVARSMGGIGIGLQSPDMINPLNPASYASVDSLTFIFDFGISAQTTILSEGSRRAHRWLGNFDYLAVLFPVGKYMAISGGVLPLSSVGYDYGFAQNIPGTTDSSFEKRFSGKGNISNAYLGLSVRPFSWWSLGVNAQYLFGHLDHDRKITYSQAQSDNLHFADNLSVQGIGLQVGSLWTWKASDDKSVSLGATFSPRMSLSSTRLLTQTIERSQSSPALISADTVSSSEQYALPMSYGLGISYQKKNKLILGADVSYSRWAAALKDHLSEYDAEDRWTVRFGGGYTPNHRSPNYWQRIQYRMGLHGENSYISFLNQDQERVKYYKWGASVGATLPMVDRRSAIDLSLGYYRLQPTVAHALSENYLQISVALRFNEGWFKKMKLD